MSGGFASAERILLLNYLSPFLAVSFIAPWRNRHFIIPASIFRFVLLKLVAIFSTSFFILQDVTMTSPPNSFLTTDKLDGRNFGGGSTRDSLFNGHHLRYHERKYIVFERDNRSICVSILYYHIRNLQFLNSGRES